MPNPKILIIEDNTADIQILRFALDEHGEEYDLEVLTDGEEALRFVHEHRLGSRPPNPCVILLDLHLPRQNGLQVLRAVMESPPLSHIKVVMLTGFASPAEQVKIAELGALYRAKPTSIDEYIQLAAEVLRICKGASVTTA